MSTVTPEREVRTRQPYRLSVQQYHQLAESGVLGKNDRVELIDGILVEKMTKNELHVATTWLIDTVLTKRLPDGWFAATESPVVLARSEPEPDVLVVRGKVSDYFRRKPSPTDLALVVEVADTSYSDDLARCRLYAEAGIVCYWIANIRERRIEVYTEPSGAVYKARHEFALHESIPLRIDDLQTIDLAVRDLLAVT